MRSFISIDVGAMDSLVSLEKELGEAGVSLKLVEPENIHLTLKFLGEIDEELVPKIEEAMREAVNGIEPFTAELVGTGARVKGARGKEKLREILSKNMQKNFGKVRVESIRLKKSELRKEGPLYTTLLDVKL